MDLPDEPMRIEVLAAFTTAVDARLDNNRQRSDMGEMGQMAAVESLADMTQSLGESLFEIGLEQARQSFAQLGTVREMSTLGLRFFGRLMFKCMDFFLSRCMSNHLGDGKRFATLRQVDDFNQALETHCLQAAVIVERFSGEWFSTHNWETSGNISRPLASAFAHGAMQKLLEELKRGAPCNG
jgi:hypothetical protein